MKEGQTQEPVGGMGWVKASDRLPEDNDSYHIQYEGYKDIAYCESGEWYNAGTDNLLPKAFVNNLEWLDENYTPLPAPIKTEGEYVKHICQYCGALTTQPDSKCWNNPNNYKYAEGEDDISSDFHAANSTPAPPSPVGIELVDIPAPIGNFIIEQKDITGTMGNDGMYYHYSQVCVLLNRLKASLPQSSTEEEKELWEEAYQIIRPYCTINGAAEFVKLQSKFKISKR